MHRLVIASTFALLPAMAAAQDGPRADDFWRTDLDAARAEAADADRPLFVLFRCER